jgi:hypothetical protein
MKRIVLGAGNSTQAEGRRFTREVPEAESLVTRIGNVFYWAGCALALGWLLFCVLQMSSFGSIYQPPSTILLTVTLGGAAVIWMVGRAIRYVLTGK